MVWELKQTHLFWGRSNRCWFLGKLDVGIFCWNREQQWNPSAPGSHQTMGGRRTWIFTNACVYCVPAMVIKWCFRAAPCYSWAPRWHNKNEWPVRSCQGGLPRKTFFKKLCVYHNGGSHPTQKVVNSKGIRTPKWHSFRLRIYWWNCSSYVWCSFFQRTYNLGPKK